MSVVKQSVGPPEPIPSESPITPAISMVSKVTIGRSCSSKLTNENHTINKVGILEQENLELKSQIELLRAALMDLCNEKSSAPF